MTTRTQSQSQSPNANDTPGRTGPQPEHKVTDNVARAAHEAVDRAAGTVGRAEERVRRVAAEGEDRLRERSTEARESTERALEQFRRYTRENPLTSAGIAFVAGICLSRLLSR